VSPRRALFAKRASGDGASCSPWSGVIDWEDPVAARSLTKTLLHHDFGLEWDLPIERLCPPVRITPAFSSRFRGGFEARQ
jgi:hypothetical protein